MKKILVIDDEEDIRTAIQDFLETQEFEVVLAQNGKEGLAKLEKEQPDLVILDVELPDMSGYAVCQRIRSAASSRYTPVIMLTAHALEKEELHGLESGADDYLSKPFKPARLLARIETAIGRNERQLDANPLTHLPGNKEIFQEIQNRITHAPSFSVLYFDLNNFKSFNDRYGFVRGDQAIQLTGRILSEYFEASKSVNPFLGHIGGDDYVGIVNSHDPARLCEQIIARFNTQIVSLYDEEDRVRGKIMSVDRRGNQMEFPIMGLGIAVVTNRQKKFQHPGEISLIAGELKKWVKTFGHSTYAIDRRT